MSTIAFPTTFDEERRAPGVVTLTGKIGGKVNDEPFIGSAAALYLPRQNIISAQIELDHHIPSFMPETVSSTSIVSVNCSMFSGAMPGAVNLADICGPEIEGTVDFVMHDLRKGQNVLGAVRQKFNFQRRSQDQVEFETTLEGWSRSPLDVRVSPGYVVYMRQVKPGEIEACTHRSSRRKTVRVAFTS